MCSVAPISNAIGKALPTPCRKKTIRYCLLLKCIIELYSPSVSWPTLFSYNNEIWLNADPFWHYPTRMIRAPAFNHNMEEMDNWKSTPGDNVWQSAIFVELLTREAHFRYNSFVKTPSTWGSVSPLTWNQPGPCGKPLGNCFLNVVRLFTWVI